MLNDLVEKGLLLLEGGEDFLNLFGGGSTEALEVIGEVVARLEVREEDITAVEDAKMTRPILLTDKEGLGAVIVAIGVAHRHQHGTRDEDLINRTTTLREEG